MSLRNILTNEEKLFIRAFIKEDTPNDADLYIREILNLDSEQAVGLEDAFKVTNNIHARLSEMLKVIVVNQDAVKELVSSEIKDEDDETQTLVVGFTSKLSEIRLMVDQAPELIVTDDELSKYGDILDGFEKKLIRAILTKNIVDINELSKIINPDNEMSEADESAIVVSRLKLVNEKLSHLKDSKINTAIYIAKMMMIENYDNTDDKEIISVIIPIKIISGQYPGILAIVD